MTPPLRWGAFAAGGAPWGAKSICRRGGDSGGSNGYRLRLWKVELPALVDESGFGVDGVSLVARDQQVEQD